MAMNAVQAAKTIDFGGSLALDPSLRSGVKAADVFRIGAELAFDKLKVGGCVNDIAEQLKSKGSQINLREALASDRVQEIKLNDEQRAAFKRLEEIAAKNNPDLEGAVERSFAEDGMGVPAIALIIVLVIVFVAVISHR